MLLYNLALHQKVQDKLREEVMTLLPNADTALTPESLNSLPYMRACLKESMRINPIIAGNVRAAGRDLVLQGYQVPKGVKSFPSLQWHNFFTFSHLFQD